MTTPRRCPVDTARTHRNTLRTSWRSNPDGRSWTARENLADILERELLGPLNGPEEVIDGVPDAVYLVGGSRREADRGRATRPTATPTSPVPTWGTRPRPKRTRAFRSAGPTRMARTRTTQRGSRTSRSGGADDPRVDGAALPGARRPGVVHGDRVLGGVRAGQRRRGEGAGGAVQAHPGRDPKTDHGRRASTTADDRRSRSRTRSSWIDRYDDPERGCLLIELALCNDRETPRKIPVNAWLYQTKLMVTAAGPRCSCRPATRCRPTAEEDDEVRRLNLQYRDRLEFAVGRTCSVDWKVATGARRAPPCGPPGCRL